jgi:hypothetical protein
VEAPAAHALATAEARTAQLEVQLAASRARETGLEREVALLRQRHASAAAAVAAAEARTAGLECEVALLRPRHASAAVELGMRRFAASEEAREAEAEISKTCCALYEKAQQEVQRLHGLLAAVGGPSVR